MHEIVCANTKAKLRRLSHFCIKNSLYHPGWTLKSWYSSEIYDGNKLNHIFVCRYNKVPAGVLVVRNDCKSEHNFGVYVKPDFRLKGIGRLLVEEAKNKGITLFPWKGSNEAARFYDKVLPGVAGYLW